MEVFRIYPIHLACQEKPQISLGPTRQSRLRIHLAIPQGSVWAQALRFPKSMSPDGLRRAAKILNFKSLSS